MMAPVQPLPPPDRILATWLRVAEDNVIAARELAAGRRLVDAYHQIDAAFLLLHDARSRLAQQIEAARMTDADTSSGAR